MTQPKYQKARILKSRLFPHMIGQSVWVKNREPVVTGYCEIMTNRDLEPAPCLYSHLCDPHGNLMVFALEFLELTGEFTNKEIVEVPFAVWSQPEWKGCDD